MNLLRQLLSVLIIMSLVACNDSDSSNSQEPAKLSVKLVDNPGDYENVFVEITDVMIKYGNTSDDSENNEDEGWVSIGIIEPGIYDLLELTGGINLPLVENENIEPGVIKQIRLVLGSSNSIVLDGEIEARPLTTPSAQQSGLKVMVNQPIESGFNYSFILDFDVDESIVVAGNSGNIILKPVLRANLEVNSGSIEGSVIPSDLAVEIEVSNESTTASTFTDDLGNYEVIGLPAGIYTVTLTPEESSLFEPVVLTDILVTVGNTTILDVITFE
jgi:hypothetical protein